MHILVKALSFSLSTTLLLGISGCPTEDDTLEDNFDDSIEWNTRGCSDVFIYSYNDDDTIALFFSSRGQVEETFEAGTTVTYTFDLSEQIVDVNLQEGSLLTVDACDDVFEPDHQPEILRAYTAIEGIAQLTITPGEYPDDGASAELQLLDVVFQAVDDPELIMDDFGPVTAFVGWLPG